MAQNHPTEAQIWAEEASQNSVKMAPRRGKKPKCSERIDGAAQRHSQVRVAICVRGYDKPISWAKRAIDSFQVVYFSWLFAGGSALICFFLAFKISVDVPMWWCWLDIFLDSTWYFSLLKSFGFFICWAPGKTAVSVNLTHQLETPKTSCFQLPKQKCYVQFLCFFTELIRK